MKAKITLASALIILLAVILILALSSCTVTKAKQSYTKDSTSVTKQDTGKVSSNTSSNDSKWFRETIYYKDGRDTNINNNYYITQPVKIIREGGSQVNTHSSYDSGWGEKFDSLTVAIQESKKDKKEETFTFLQLVGVALVCIAISVLLSKIKFSFK
jgi:uncharacterized protein YxeA